MKNIRPVVLMANDVDTITEDNNENNIEIENQSRHRKNDSLSFVDKSDLIEDINLNINCNGIIESILEELIEDEENIKSKRGKF